MGFCDTFGFSSSQYRQHLKDYDDHQLRKKHHQKILFMQSSAASAGFAVGAASLTAGASLVGAAYSARQWRVLHRQCEVIEQEMERRGVEVPRIRLRDVFGGAALGCVSAAAGMSIAGGVDVLSGTSTEAVAHGASSHILIAAAGHTSTVTQGIGEGMQMAASNQFHHLTNTAAHWIVESVPLDAAGNVAAHSAGQAIGITMVQHAEAIGVSRVSGMASEHAMMWVTSAKE